MKTIVQGFLVALAATACIEAPAQSFQWEQKDSLLPESDLPAPRVRLDDARRRLDDLRDNATADDYRTIRVQDKNGRAAFRRVPTEEFASRIERAERDRDNAEAQIKAQERSLY